MTNCLRPQLLGILLAASAVSSPCSAAGDESSIDAAKLPAAADRDVDFIKDIQPLLAKSCYACHGPEKQESGLRLDNGKLALAGGDGGAVIVPGKSADSRLVHLVAGLDEDTGRMPPEGEGEPLADEQIALVRKWIDAGAHWPEAADDVAAPEASKHWSFQPVVHPDPPPVGNVAWVRNRIDAFILSKLEKEGVTPAPEADRVTLLRRLYLDLLGLPPNLEEIDAFLADNRPDAYERLVDRLLESPHFGERWGRHWLDVARYADTDGYEADGGRPFAWRYRDWVIDAVNRDLPFDAFTVQQLAGDLLTPSDPEYDTAARAATGFHRNTLINKEGGIDKEEDRVKRTIDRTNTLGAVWMGLTVGCANCHSHKYDPLSQREFFGLYAFFNSLDEVDLPVSPDTPKELAQSVSQLATPRETCVHLRGDFLSKGPVVEEHTPAVLPKMAARNSRPDRLDLARWLMSSDHPLTARVAVNRLWQQHFGRGLVATGEDFGTQGEPPSHPALLDWLAAELRAGGWRLKQMHRLLVTSATYRQSSQARPELADRDPYNTWLARQNRLRVEGEIVRDLALAASGLLNRQVGGPSVRPPQPPGISEITYSNNAKWVESTGADRYRRGLYIWFQRTSPYPLLVLFDAPESNLACTRRERSSTPLQALSLLNDVTLVECAQALARRMAIETTASAGDAADIMHSRIRFAVRLSLSREPTPRELTLLSELYNDASSMARDNLDSAQKLLGPLPPEADPAELAGCMAVARTILNLDEFITRE